jgi:hypothetical protein
MNRGVHSWCFSWSICDWCGRMAPCRPASRKQGLLLPRYRRSYRRIHLIGSPGRRSRECRNRLFFFICCMSPSRSHTTCKRPELLTKYIREYDVLRLYVAMQYVLTVYILHGLANLCQFCSSLLLWESFAQFAQPVKWPFLHVLHHNVDMILIAEASVHADDVGMVEEEVDLYLLCELVQH